MPEYANFYTTTVACLNNMVSDLFFVAAPVVKKRFTMHVKEPDSRSYSVPNLTKVDGVEQNVVELHAQQGSDPNLLSESYQDYTDMLKKVRTSTVFLGLP